MIRQLRTKTVLKAVAGVALLSTLGLGLSACSSSKKVTETPVTKPSVQEVRAILKSQIKQDNVKVIHVGQTIRLILPSAYFFKPNSANLYKSKVEALARISHYIGTFRQSDVRVTGYTANTLNAKFLEALSAKQAEVVQHRLWTLGIKTQLVIADGLGEKGAVNTNQTVAGRFSNNRVEISFMYREDTPLYD